MPGEQLQQRQSVVSAQKPEASATLNTRLKRLFGFTETERMMRTIKEELLWLHEFSSLEEAKRAVSHWIEVDYNGLYVHSAPGYLSPEEFEYLYLSQLSLRESA